MQTRLRQITIRHLVAFCCLLLLLYFTWLWANEKPLPIPGFEQRHEQVLALFSVVGSLVSFILAIVFPKSFLDRPLFSKKTSEDKPLSDKTRTTNRANMLELVEKVWVTGYLDNVLNQHIALKIPMGFTDPEKVVHRPGLEDYTLPDATQIDRAFHDLNERLVILGEPGAGKTVALAQLCKGLIAEARADTRKPIPVILSLTSFAAEAAKAAEEQKSPSFEAWLRKELVDKYPLPRKAAEDFVLGEQLTYLLDGLDEVAASQRENCLKAIKVFFEDERRLVQYALCCRRKEFMALETRLDVIGELMQQPLTHAQIDHYLATDEFDGLRVVMSDNVILQGFALVPFMLNTMAVVARGLQERKLRLMLADQDSSEALRDAFLEQYIQRRMSENTHANYPDLYKTRHYLHWLAGQLVAHDQTDFYIENMQPDWLGDETKQRRYRWTLLWTVGLAGKDTIIMIERVRWTLRRDGLAGGLGGGLAGCRAGWLAGWLAGWCSGWCSDFNPLKLSQFVYSLTLGCAVPGAIFSLYGYSLLWRSGWCSGWRAG